MFQEQIKREDEEVNELFWHAVTRLPFDLFDYVNPVEYLKINKKCAD